MFRKTMIAIAAIGTLSAAALAPTTASAWGGKGWGGGKWGGGYHHHHRHWGGYGLGLGVIGATVAYNSCMKKRWVDTPYGLKLRWVNVCY